MKRSTTSTGRCSSRFTSRTTTSARSTRAFACLSIRPIFAGAFQAVGGERFFCEQVNVRWPMPPAATPKFAAYQNVLMDVLAGRRPPFAAIWMCLFSGQLVEWYPFTMVVTTYTPLSPTRTRLRSEYYFDREIAETRRDYVETGLAVLDEVTGEDHVRGRDSAERPADALRPRRESARAVSDADGARAAAVPRLPAQHSPKCGLASFCPHRWAVNWRIDSLPTASYSAAISVAPDPRIPSLHEELRKIKGENFEVITSPAGYKKPR